jgi:hypothetical protein
VVLVLVGGGAYLMRHRLLDTLFNRQVFSCLMISLGFMVFGRVVGLFIPIPPAAHFARDSFVTAAVMAVCAVAMLRWTAVIALLFGVSGTLCIAFPAACVAIFSATTVITMSLATFMSWWIWRSLPTPDHQ